MKVEGELKEARRKLHVEARRRLKEAKSPRNPSSAICVRCPMSALCSRHRPVRCKPTKGLSWRWDTPRTARLWPRPQRTAVSASGTQQRCAHPTTIICTTPPFYAPHQLLCYRLPLGHCMLFHTPTSLMLPITPVYLSHGCLHPVLTSIPLHPSLYSRLPPYPLSPKWGTVRYAGRAAAGAWWP